MLALEDQTRQTSSPAPGAGAPSARDRVAAFMELTKPGITRLVLLTTAVGFYIASRGAFDLILLCHTLFGTALVSSAAGALNEYVERDIDARMRRTRYRPLPSGRVLPRQAVLFALALAAAGLLYLAILVNGVTAVIVGLSLLSYVLVYTPLKRKTSLSTLIGSFPGALPILAGWTAAGEPLGPGAWALFWIVFVWQLPHFLALAWIFREDYRKGGFVMLSLGDDDGRRTGRQILLYGATLLPISLLPTLHGLTGKLYFFGALALGLAFLAAGAGMTLRRTDRRAWRLFYASVAYLPALLLLMVIDKVPG
ncbi:MAG TPA: heme o synthase [Longimicrobiales bacterium]